MRERFERFMRGRYGVDQFSNFLVILAVVLMVLDFFIRVSPVHEIINILTFIAAICAYMRIFSKNHYKRSAENEKFLKIYNRVRFFAATKKSHMEQRKTHRIYKCPNCRQSIRVPKGKGRIAITCPMCHTEFIKRS